MKTILSEDVKNKTLLYLIAMVAALSGLLFGYNTGVISGAILFINAELQLSAMQTSFLMSAALLAACISAALSGRIVDYFGRVQIIMINAVIFFAGSMLSAISNSGFEIFASRLLLGVAIGMSSYVAPLYISEIAAFKNRGLLVGFNQLFITIGILASYVINYFFSFGGHWRLMLGLGAFPAVLLYLGAMFIPESPRWLVAKGQLDKARAMLQQIRAKVEVDYEVAEIKTSVSEQRGDWRMLFKPWLFPAVVIGFGIAMFQQIVGINVIIYYAPILLNLAGFSTVSYAILANLGIGVILVFFTIIALPLIDSWGRRPLLILGLVSMILGWIILSIGGRFFAGDLHKWVMLAGMVVYIPGFAISLGPVGWLMITEVFPLRIRGLAVSLATAIIWGFNLLVTFTLLPLVNLIGVGGVFDLYAILCVVGLFFVYFLVPETKNVSLEHIETNLRQGKRSRELGA